MLQKLAADQQILDISKIEVGQLELSHGTFTLKDSTTGYIEKPINPETFVAELRSYL